MASVIWQNNSICSCGYYWSAAIICACLVSKIFSHNLAARLSCWSVGPKMSTKKWKVAYLNLEKKCLVWGLVNNFWKKIFNDWHNIMSFCYQKGVGLYTQFLWWSDKIFLTKSLFLTKKFSCEKKFSFEKKSSFKKV